MGDLLDAPGRRAEHEGLALARLEHHLLVELADAALARLRADEEHAVQPAVRDRAAAGERDACRALARAQTVRDAVPHDAGPQLRELVGREASRQHVEDAFEDRTREIGERRGAAHDALEVVDGPRLDRDHRDDLLREDVERIARVARLLDRAGVHPLGERGAREQVAAELRHDHALARRVDAVAGAADALHAARDGRRRLDLDDEIDRAHVDAQLERRRRHERAQAARLQVVLDAEALLARDRAVMRMHQLLARELVHRAGDPLREAAAVDEDERRAMLADELEQTRMYRGPDARACVGA